MTYPLNFPGVLRALFCVREFRFERRFFQVCSSWSEAACRFVAARVIVAVTQLGQELVHITQMNNVSFSVNGLLKGWALVIAKLIARQNFEP